MKKKNNTKPKTVADPKKADPKKNNTKPKTVADLKAADPKLYGEFCRQKLKYGVTFRNFVSHL